jgi:2-keto-3-deoxy-L-rhamnonate aldolase RhmA
MKTSALKLKLKNREIVFAAWVSFSHPSITEIFAQGPFDFIAIDLEHSTINLEQAQRIMAASQAYGKPCLPRPVSHSNDYLKPLLDSGADGIIAPLVSTSDDSSLLLKLIKYPPMGKRSFGVNRAQNYGLDFDEYISNWNENSVFIPQIETKDAVENINDIIADENVDAVMVGPYDLSGSYGYPGQTNHPIVLGAQQKVIDACASINKSCGTQIKDFSLSNISNCVSLGYNLIFASSDLFILSNWTENANELIKNFKDAGRR